MYKEKIYSGIILEIHKKKQKKTENYQRLTSLKVSY